MSILGRVFRRMAFRAMRGVYRRRGFIAVGAVLVAGFLVVSTLNLLPTDLLPSPSSGGGNAYVGSVGNDRVVRLNTKSSDFTEYLLPRSTNIRRVFVDNSTTPVTFWVGSNHGASIIMLEPLD